MGSVDIIVNNAGIWLTSYIKDMDVDDFRNTLDVNLIGPFLLSKRFINYCIDNNKKGKIVNLTSQAAFHGSTSGHAHYASSKAGLVAFTISLAREVAPYGINVNARMTAHRNSSGKKTKPKTLDMIYNDEVPDALRTAVSMCESKGIDVSDLLVKHKDNNT